MPCVVDLSPMRDRMTLTVGALTAVVIAALVGFALVLAGSLQASRDDIEGRLQDRAEAGATLISSVFSSAAASGRANLIRRYGGEQVSVDALARQARESRNVFLAIAEPDGTVIAATPGTPASVATAVRARPAWFRAALAGPVFSPSNVADSAAPGTLTFAQAFPSAGGTRILVSGSDPRILAAFFAASLERLPAVEGGRTYLLDADGAVLESTGLRARLGSRAPQADLLAALPERTSGNLEGDRFFAANAVEGTPWRVVLSAPRDELFASVEGLNKWGPWGLFAGFAVAALAAVGLVRRTFRDAQRIEAVNAQLADRAGLLAASNAQLEQSNVELERSNGELERFASIASHDLREPLRKVQMFSERVIHHESDNLSDRGRDYLGRMDAAAARMQTLIDGLLAYARVTTRMEPLEDVDLGQVAREVADDLDAVCREAGGQIVIGELPYVPAEPLRMRQLLQNLISNGLRFHRDGEPPVVHVSGRVDGDDVVLVVVDNGIGFEPRHGDRIFELFERLNPRGSYPGTGMGLALCRRIVERHGGSIAAMSTPGDGSTFTVRLPRVVRTDDPSAQETTTPRMETPLVPS